MKHRNWIKYDKKWQVQIMIALFIAFAGLTGCRNVTNETIEATEVTEAAGVPASYMITKDNEFDYQSGMECAAYASAYVLRFFGEEAKGLELFADYPNKAPDGGVMPTGIVTFFEERGYHAEYVRNGTIDDVKAQVALGVPVIVFIHVDEPVNSIHNTHYVPVVGYDEEYLYLAESLRDKANCIDEPDVPYNRKIANAEFMILWENIDGMWDYPYYRISK